MFDIHRKIHGESRWNEQQDSWEYFYARQRRINYVNERPYCIFYLMGA